MKNILLSLLLLSGMVFLLFSCTNDSTMNEEEMEDVMDIDSLKHLTPCLAEIILNYRDYVLNDSIPSNDEFNLVYVLTTVVDSTKYYWLVTNWVDETEYIITDECAEFCYHNNWVGFEDVCSSQFRNSIWKQVWTK